MQRLQKANVQQIKHYNINYQLKSYAVSNLMLLSVQNFTQKRFNKKLLYKFIDLFRMKNKINE